MIDLNDIVIADDVEGNDHTEVTRLLKIFDCLSDYDFSKSIDNLYGDKFKCVGIKNNEWYSFTDKKLWEKDECGESLREKITNEYRKHFNDYLMSIQDKLTKLPLTEDNEKMSKFLKLQIKNINTIVKKLGAGKDIVHIFNGLKDIKIDKKFKDTVNRTMFILPLRDGKILDLRTLEVKERTIDDYFSFECDADYLTLTKEQNDEMEQYLMDLFCDDKDIVKCFCDIIKSSITGRPLRYVFFYTGEGRNGKTTLLNIIQKMLGKMMDVISKKAIVKSNSGSHLNTELEKMDKIRFAYTDELKNTDELNTEIIKAITGGSPLNLRTLNTTDFTIKPTCSLHNATNQMAKVDVEPAVKARLIVLPFDNTFPVNVNFENEMIEKRDLLFSYIMQHGTLRDNFDEVPEKMRVATEDYFENNDTNPVKRFLDECIEFVEDERIKREDFRQEFNFWCNRKGFRVNNDTNKVFTTMLKKYKINSKESNHKVYYTGIRIKPEEEE
jgi:P4 family phage/plasmid primase-like protien